MNEKPNEAKGSLRPGREVDLGSLVFHQPGAVVSRTILGAKAGTVTLVAFDAGEGLSGHAAHYDALRELLEGRAEVTVAGNERRLGGGRAILLPAG